MKLFVLMVVSILCSFTFAEHEFEALQNSKAHIYQQDFDLFKSKIKNLVTQMDNRKYLAREEAQNALTELIYSKKLSSEKRKFLKEYLESARNQTVEISRRVGKIYPVSPKVVLFKELIEEDLRKTIKLDDQLDVMDKILGSFTKEEKEKHQELTSKITSNKNKIYGGIFCEGCKPKNEKEKSEKEKLEEIKKLVKENDNLKEQINKIMLSVFKRANISVEAKQIAANLEEDQADGDDINDDEDHKPLKKDEAKERARAEILGAINKDYQYKFKVKEKNYTFSTIENDFTLISDDKVKFNPIKNILEQSKQHIYLYNNKEEKDIQAIEMTPSLIANFKSPAYVAEYRFPNGQGGDGGEEESNVMPEKGMPAIAKNAVIINRSASYSGLADKIFYNAFGLVEDRSEDLERDSTDSAEDRLKDIIHIKSERADQKDKPIILNELPLGHGSPVPV